MLHVVLAMLLQCEVYAKKDALVLIGMYHNDALKLRILEYKANGEVKFAAIDEKHNIVSLQLSCCNSIVYIFNKHNSLTIASVVKSNDTITVNQSGQYVQYDLKHDEADWFFEHFAKRRFSSLFRFKDPQIKSRYVYVVFNTLKTAIGDFGEVLIGTKGNLRRYSFLEKKVVNTEIHYRFSHQNYQFLVVAENGQYRVSYDDSRLIELQKISKPSIHYLKKIGVRDGLSAICGRYLEG